MKLDLAMLANHAEIQNGLAYVNGGGIDTINAPQLPAQFIGGVFIRFLLHPTETDRPHTIQIRITTQDGQMLAQLNAQLNVSRTADMPVGWLYPAMLAINVNGLALPTEGHYSMDVLADDNHMASLPFRVRIAPSPTAR